MKICNHCHQELKTLNIKSKDKSIEIGLDACINPECPSFGLVQISEEKMMRLSDYAKKRLDKR